MNLIGIRLKIRLKSERAKIKSNSQLDKRQREQRTPTNKQKWSKVTKMKASLQLSEGQGKKNIEVKRTKMRGSLQLSEGPREPKNNLNKGESVRVEDFQCSQNTFLIQHHGILKESQTFRKHLIEWKGKTCWNWLNIMWGLWDISSYMSQSKVFFESYVLWTFGTLNVPFWKGIPKRLNS